LIQPEDFTALLALHQTFERLGLTLQTMDRLRLLTIRIHRRHQTTVQQFLIDVDGSGGEEHHHRPSTRYCCVTSFPSPGPCPSRRW
jgi:hypothetical protein